MTDFQQIPRGKYFISHSYKDAVVRDAFLKEFPGHIEPFVFPPISVSPLEFVSSTLIGAILACDGLIYLNEGASQSSFWVAFERDYAIRAKKQVFGFTPSTQILDKHEDTPLDLAIFPSYSRPQQKKVGPILEFMSRQRFFDPWMENLALTPGSSWVDALQNGQDEIFRRGGYVLTFLGDFNSEFVMKETVSGLEKGRLLVAGLGIEIPSFLQQYHNLFIQLVENDAINNNRIDDLIVRLYWLMFGVQFPQYLENG